MTTLRNFLNLISNGCEVFVEVDGKEERHYIDLIDDVYVTDSYIDFDNNCLYIKCINKAKL